MNHPISTTDAVHSFIQAFMSRLPQQSGVSATMGTNVSAWNTRLPKDQKEELIAELLQCGVNVAVLRNQATDTLEGEYFITFFSDDRDITSDYGYQLLMRGFQESKMYLDTRFA